jgi:hypothetical protein
MTEFILMQVTSLVSWSFVYCLEFLVGSVEMELVSLKFSNNSQAFYISSTLTLSSNLRFGISVDLLFTMFRVK